MEVSITPAEALGAVAAEELRRLLDVRPDAVAAFPTGNTPLPLFRELRSRHAAGWRAPRMRVVMLDDYLDGDAAFSFRLWLRREILDPLQVEDARLLPIPTGRRGLTAACTAFERRLEAWGGCDLLYLGLGWNGHLGFNEPGSAPDSRTRAVRLTAETGRLNALYRDGGAAPLRAVTMGLGTMLASRRIVLLASGASKAAVLARAIDAPPTAALPASCLQTAPNVRVIADAAAARLLSATRTKP